MLSENEILNRLELLKNKMKEEESKPPVMKEKGWQNKANPLLLEYPDYRTTKLWKTIKKRILARDKNTCQRCKGSSELVHHLSYEDDVMLGNNDEKLISLCCGCHELIHFTSEGIARNAAEQELVMQNMSFNEKIPKIDLRTSPHKVKLWKRLTCIQKSEFVKMYNEKKFAHMKAKKAT